MDDTVKTPYPLTKQQAAEVMEKWQEIIDFYWTKLAENPFLEYEAVSLLGLESQLELFIESHKNEN